MDKIFKEESTQKAFESWLKISTGIAPNTPDKNRFYAFAYEYFKHGEFIDKDTFVKKCKAFTHTTRSTNRGVCQKYYEKLELIVDFLKYYNY